MKHDHLSRLLRPKSIAVIGGGAVSDFVMENCAKIGFRGPVWHVHPKRGAFTSVTDLPAPPDAAFIGVNRAATLEIVQDLRDMGAGGAVAYASGFSEAAAELSDGTDLQVQLLQSAGDMPLIGPNCYGFLNYLDGAGLWPDQQGGQPVKSGVAIITQSSNIAINLSMQRRGVPLAYLVTAGNQAQLGLAQIGAALLRDPRVTCLGLHIEGIGDIRAFESLATLARDLGKPIVALKAGLSDQAQIAAVSHTASLAGSSAGAQAFLARLGIAQVASLTALLETLKLLHVTGPLTSNRIASMSCSGGEASLMADASVHRDLDFPPLNDRQKTALKQALGPKVALANPLDYHTYIWADQPAMAETYAAMMHGDIALGLVIADFPRADRCSDEDWEPVINAVAQARLSSGKPMGILASLPENMPEAHATRLIDLGIAPMGGIDDTLSAIEAAAWLGSGLADPEPILLPGTPKDAQLLTEAEGKAALCNSGVKIPANFNIKNAKEVTDKTNKIRFPAVLKGEGVAHKTEAGAVVLNLQNPDQLVAAVREMTAPSYLVEEMITGGVAEILIGVIRDAAHGFVLTLAAGGTLTELLRDSSSLLLPVTEIDITDTLKTLRIYPLLNGFRGTPAADLSAIIAAVLGVQDYVIANAAEIEEVEINPLICTPDRAVAADVLIRIGGRPTTAKTGDTP